jgi:hypothetical protein
MILAPNVLEGDDSVLQKTPDEEVRELEKELEILENAFEVSKNRRLQIRIDSVKNKISRAKANAAINRTTSRMSSVKHAISAVSSFIGPTETQTKRRLPNSRFRLIRKNR